MGFELANIFSPIVKQNAVIEVEKSNEYAKQFGLILSQRQAEELVETRSLSLKTNGRIEFGGGVINKVIFEFCDSPFISMHNYAETINVLIEIFYFYKNETLDLISDDDLIKYMKKYFDGICQGSLELLADRELARLALNLKSGYSPDFTGDENEEEEDE